MHKPRTINSPHMAKKRKLESEPSQPQQKIKEEEKIFAEEEEEEDPEEIAGYESEEVEYEEVEYEEEEVEEEEDEEEEEEEAGAEEDDRLNDGDDAEEPILCANDGGDAAEQIQSNKDGGEAGEQIQSNNDGSNAVQSTESSNDGDEEEDEEDESIQSVLAAFSKEKLIALLSEAAGRHNDVAARVWASAEVDQSQRKIFVHGLKWDATSEALFEEFLKYGDIEDCRVIINKATGRSKGYGFVLFKTCRGARQALKEPQKLISGRMTSSQLASLGPLAVALPQKPQQSLSEYTQRKIYVSNAGEELDPEKLKCFFSNYGEIEEGPLGLDRETGRPKGFCLFTYKTVESAKLALAEPHKQFEGVTLYCQQAIDGPKHQKSVAKNQQFVDNVAASRAVDSIIVPPSPYMHVPPPMVQQPQPQPLHVDPAAVGHALTTLLAAQGGGLNLLGALGAVGAATGMLNNPAMVPGFGGPVVQGGYGMNRGSNGVEGYWNQGRFPADQRRWRGLGRGHYGPRPYRGQ